jgi:hypothetical protein
MMSEGRGKFKDRDKTLRGFDNLCGEGIHNFASATSNREEWVYKDPLVVGVLRNNENDKFTVCRVALEDSETHAIRSAKCELLEMGSNTKSPRCKHCNNQKSAFLARCSRAATKREQENLPRSTRLNTLNSPTLLKKRIRTDSKHLKKLHIIIIRLRAKRSRKNGVRLPDGLQDIFEKTSDEDASKWFSEEMQVSDDDIRHILFMESLKNARIAQQSGSKRMRHSPLMVRTCIKINQKLGRRDYDELAKTFFLPSQRTVDKYKTIGANEPDGIMHDTCAESMSDFEEIFSDAEDEDMKKWGRHGCLGYDAAKCRDRVVYNFHTGELMGFAYDAFDVNIISEEWAAASKQVESEFDSTVRTPKHKDKGKKDKLPLAKHFLAFYFTTWSPMREKTQFCVARYGMEKISGVWLAETIPLIAAVLAQYGFVVNAIVSDGAAENRSANHLLGEISAREVLKLSDSQMQQFSVDGGLLDMKIAFKHPTPVGVAKDVIIFILSDMPHWVKKFVNAMERTGKDNSETDLWFNGGQLSLAMLEDMWIADGGGEGSGLRTDKFSQDHFTKDAFNRMRVYLAVQVCSMSMCELIDLHATRDLKPLYQSLRRVIVKVDRLVDICNGTRENHKGVKKGCHNLNSPKHPLVKELLDILALFAKWKGEAGRDTKRFIPWQSYEDLCWIVFGFVGLAQTYLSEDFTRRLVQRRGSTDVLEHLFGNIRAMASAFDCGQARRLVATGEGMRQASQGNNRAAPKDRTRRWGLVNRAFAKTKKAFS